MGPLTLTPRVLGVLKQLASAGGLHDRLFLTALREGVAPNWAGIPLRYLDGMPTMDVAGLTSIAARGVPVAWVPRSEVLAEILASGAQYVRPILLGAEAEVLDDCAAVVAKVVDGPLVELAHLLREAATTASDGHHAGAQALAANVLDTTLRRAFPLGQWQSYRRVREAISECRRSNHLAYLRSGLTWAPILLAIDTFDGGNFTSTPVHFNRHATAHAVGRAQYNRYNALIATMMAASALRESHEHQRRVAASSIR